MLFLGLLTACSPENPLRLIKAESSDREPLQKSENNQNNPQNDGINAPVALPPRFENGPLAPGQTDTTYMPNGLPALKPMKGINADTLFSEKIKNTDDRFSRVETAVVDLRKEFETYRPAIVRLAAVESDIQNLIKELEILLQETPNQQPPLDLTSRSEPSLQVQQLDPQPPPPPEPQDAVSDREYKAESKPTPKATSPPAEPPRMEEPPDKPKPPEKPIEKYDGIVATNLRIGEHADKVRIVLDTNQKTGFSIDLDNNEKLIIVELPDARWVGKNSESYKSSKLIDSYVTEEINGGKGTMVVISLKKATSVIQEKRLTPDGSIPYHRIYFDLKP